MSEVSDLLVPTFPAKHVKSALSHFTNAVNDFGQGDWEDSIAKAGKCVEAILKAVATHCGVTFESGRKFKADAVMIGLGQLAFGSFDNSLRLLIPRACRVIYDIASNRGARHDSEEIDPNTMDANVVIPIAAWILAEMIRYAKEGLSIHRKPEITLNRLWRRNIRSSRKLTVASIFTRRKSLRLTLLWLFWRGDTQKELLGMT